MNPIPPAIASALTLLHQVEPYLKRLITSEADFPTAQAECNNFLIRVANEGHPLFSNAALEMAGIFDRSPSFPHHRRNPTLSELYSGIWEDVMLCASSLHQTWQEFNGSELFHHIEGVLTWLGTIKYHHGRLARYMGWELPPRTNRATSKLPQKTGRSSTPIETVAAELRRLDAMGISTPIQLAEYMGTSEGKALKDAVNDAKKAKPKRKRSGKPATNISIIKAAKQRNRLRNATS